MKLNADQIIGFAIDQAASTGFYWNLYIGVVTALIGVLMSGKVHANSKVLKAVLTIIFIVFAVGNWSSIANIGIVRQELLDLLPASYSAMVEGLSPRTYWEYVIYHGVLDVLVLTCIWMVKWPMPGKGSQ